MEIMLGDFVEIFIALFYEAILRIFEEIMRILLEN